MVKGRPHRFRRIALTLAAMLTVSLPAPAALAQVPAGEAAISDSAGLLSPAALPSALAAPSMILNPLRTDAIAPGVTLTAYEVLTPLGWVQAHVLTVDLTNPLISTDLLFPGSIAAARPLEEMARQRGAVAAINGDFFDISGTKAPLSAAVAGGTLIKGPATGWPLVAGVGQDGLGRIAEMAVEGYVVLPGGRYPITALNQHVPENGIGVFTSLWGDTSRYLTVKWGNGVKEVTVRNGVVVAVADEAGSGPIPPDTVVLLGRDAGAQALAQLKVGDRVAFQYGPKTTAEVPFSFAVGGDQVLLRSGEVQNLDDNAAHPRSAIGFSADGRKMFLVAVDGRQSMSRGMTLKQLAELLKAVGAADALNLDGGGSTTLVARKPGQTEATVANSPSERRSVPNGVGVFVQPGSGQLRSLHIVPVHDLPHADRVFPGLVRRLTVVGQDETYAPVPVTGVTWRVSPEDSRILAMSGYLVAGRTGPIRLEAEVLGITGVREIQVLGDLARIEARPGVLRLNGAPGSFRVVGYDAEGYEAPIDTMDVWLQYDPSVLSVTANGQGGFDVKPLALKGTTQITVTVRDKQVVLPVSLGEQLTELTSFEDLTGWWASAYPTGVGSVITPAPGYVGQGLRLTYDFTTTTASRAAYVNAPAGFTLPADATAVGLWVHGDGRGAWLRMVIVDGSGTSHTLDLARHVNWTGWRYVEAALPVGLPQPVTLRRIYPVETVATAQYRGELILDGLVARLPAAAPAAPAPATEPDPMVVAPADLPAEGVRFAVLSHTLLSSDWWYSASAQQLQAKLREIAAFQPDFLVLAGDVVSDPSPSRLQLLQGLITATLGTDVPVYYVPGPAEAANAALVQQYFPAGRPRFDRDGTRYILLNSGNGSLRTADFGQIAALQEALEQAAHDEGIHSVVVMAHHPLWDPQGGDHGFADAREAALVETMLTRFRSESGGKPVAFVATGEAGGIDVQRREGVRYVTVGADSWALFALGDVSSGQWLQVAHGTAGSVPVATN
ncbi:MAG TPA: phosphodiester glycosidase family protein [Symbiobacteriaceae bacterium]